MIFIIPIILGAAAIVTAGVGIATGADGVDKMNKAKKIGESAQKKYKSKQKSLEKTWQDTQNFAAEYGQLQIQVKIQTIKRFIEFVRRLDSQGLLTDKRFLEGLEGGFLHQISLGEYESEVLEAEKIVIGGGQAVGAAYAAGQGTVALVGLFGTASTGTAIGGLSGAAAWNATLAWLGGGSLAAGGGGMALGTLVLGGIAVGPALMIGGFVLGGEGEKALTKARKYEAQVKAACEKFQAAEDLLKQAQQRIAEVSDLVTNLNSKALGLLSELESKVLIGCGVIDPGSEELPIGQAKFDFQRDGKHFQQVALLIKALSEIMKTPILNAEGELNQDGFYLREKYGYFE
jgi:hypothetical protein